MCESFFATLACELFDRCRFPTQAEARLAVFDFIEGWYNPRRRHFALGYVSPVVFERRQREVDLVARGARAELPVLPDSRAEPALLPCCAGEASDTPWVGEEMNTPHYSPVH